MSRGRQRPAGSAQRSVERVARTTCAVERSLPACVSVCSVLEAALRNWGEETGERHVPDFWSGSVSSTVTAWPLSGEQRRPCDHHLSRVGGVGRDGLAGHGHDARDEQRDTDRRAVVRIVDACARPNGRAFESAALRRAKLFRCRSAREALAYRSVEALHCACTAICPLLQQGGGFPESPQAESTGLKHCEWPAAAACTCHVGGPLWGRTVAEDGSEREQTHRRAVSLPLRFGPHGRCHARQKCERHQRSLGRPLL